MQPIRVQFPSNFEPMALATPSALLCKEADGSLYWLVSLFGKLNGQPGQYCFKWVGTRAAVLLPTPTMNARGRLVTGSIGGVTKIYLEVFSNNDLFFVPLDGHVLVA